MEKTLTIDGKQVRFKATAGTMIRYKAEMGREFLTDLALIERSVTTKNGKAEILNPGMMNIDLAYGIAWALAKTADREIPDMLTWLDGFEEFDIKMVFEELIPMMKGFMKTDAKNA